ncbi:MAG: DUF1194 domain-containing protein, partial [Thalassobaculaceae bacterium]|nr:DUF1194 domain-containing protein [Thalassobaculaceae bacterium]
MIRALLLAVMLCAAIGAAPPVRAEEAVDLELVLAVDVSGSIDTSEAMLQRDGYVSALSSDEVITAITAGPLGRIALAYVEWAGLGTARTVVDWRVIDGRAAAAAFLAALEGKWPYTGRRTSISGVIQYVLPMFDDNGFTAPRRIIDISGDGPNNNGTPVLTARGLAAERGVGVNGVVILNDDPGPLGYPVLRDLDIYFEECVITGQGAFVLAAAGFADFGRAIRRKLVLEIAGLVPRRPVLRQVRGYDCLIGERQLQQWLRDNPFDP